MQLGKGIPGGCAGDLGCGCCAEQERKEEEAPDLWASAVSGCNGDAGDVHSTGRAGGREGRGSLRAGPEKEVGRGEEGEAGRVKEKRSWAWLRKWAEAGWAGLRVLSLFPIPFLFPILFYS